MNQRVLNNSHKFFKPSSNFIIDLLQLALDTGNRLRINPDRFMIDSHQQMIENISDIVRPMQKQSEEGTA